MQEAISELEVDILEQIKGLMQPGLTPKGVEVTSDTDSVSVAETTEGSWRSLLVDVQGWLHFSEEIDTTSTEAADRSLAKLLWRLCRAGNLL